MLKRNRINRYILFLSLNNSHISGDPRHTASVSGSGSGINAVAQPHLDASTLARHTAMMGFFMASTRRHTCQPTKDGAAIDRARQTRLRCGPDTSYPVEEDVGNSCPILETCSCCRYETRVRKLGVGLARGYDIMIEISCKVDPLCNKRAIQYHDDRDI